MTLQRVLTTSYEVKEKLQRLEHLPSV